MKKLPTIDDIPNLRKVVSASGTHNIKTSKFVVRERNIQEDIDEFETVMSQRYESVEAPETDALLVIKGEMSLEEIVDRFKNLRAIARKNQGLPPIVN